MRSIIIGAAGRMGHQIRKALEREGCLTAAAVDPQFAAAKETTAYAAEGAVPCYAALREVTEQADCLIDFSTPSVTKEICHFAGENRLPLLSGTTGLREDEFAALRELSKQVPVLWSANFAPGMAEFLPTLENLCAALYRTDGGDKLQMELVESHRKEKKDAPSGTAKSIVQSLSKVCPTVSVGIHSLRMDSVTGEHTLYVALPGEVIMLRHTVLDPAVFAGGAVAAAKHLVGKAPGFYTLGGPFSVWGGTA